MKSIRKRIVKNILCIVLAVAMAVIMVPAGSVSAGTPYTDEYDRKHASKYRHYEMVDGIDVSYAQGDIDWAKVKAAGIEFAFIRVGARGYGSKGNMFFDDKFVENVKGAIDNGIEVGLYFFSQALNEKEARAEAKQMLEYMSPTEGTDLYTQLRGGITDYLDKITLPIVMDYEYSFSDYGRFVAGTISKAQATSNVKAFMRVIENAGYSTCLYASASFLEDQVDGEGLAASTQIWLAHYTDQTDYAGDYNYWQYTCCGEVDGIDEEYVDLNVWYKYQLEISYYECMKAKYNGVTGWFVFKDGKIKPKYTGFAKTDKAWWYCKDGKISFNTSGIISGVVDDEYGWWYVQNGRVMFKDTVARNENGWWCITGGKVDFSYTGAAKNDYGWWRIVNGQVDFNCNSVIKNDYGWWKCTNGRIDTGFTGLARNENGWWYCCNGNVRFDYTGLVRNENGWWYVENGMVRFDKVCTFENENGEWLIVGGRVRFDYTGYFYIGEHEYYIEGGRVTYVYY
jgi:GH25 family lysozyme M1 (1,4-beta-N-acetylmuramidase)